MFSIKTDQTEHHLKFSTLNILIESLYNHQQLVAEVLVDFRATTLYINSFFGSQYKPKRGLLWEIPRSKME